LQTQATGAQAKKRNTQHQQQEAPDTPPQTELRAQTTTPTRKRPNQSKRTQTQSNKPRSATNARSKPKAVPQFQQKLTHTTNGTGDRRKKRKNCEEHPKIANFSSPTPKSTQKTTVTSKPSQTKSPKTPHKILTQKTQKAQRVQKKKINSNNKRMLLNRPNKRAETITKKPGKQHNTQTFAAETKSALTPVGHTAKTHSKNRQTKRRAPSRRQ
jgi:hypothetical protein